jgi:hypothetical protein
MDKIFDSYFQSSIEQAGKNKLQNDLILSLTNLPNSVFVSIFDVIQEAINQFEIRQSGSTFINVRSDARFLLLLNFDQMVFRPLALSFNPNNNIANNIYEDVTNILENARMNAMQKKVTEISGHEVLNACSSLWGSLKTLTNDSW